jgi:hypothetical protein
VERMGGWVGMMGGSDGWIGGKEGGEIGEQEVSRGMRMYALDCRGCLPGCHLW